MSVRTTIKRLPSSFTLHLRHLSAATQHNTDPHSLLKEDPLETLSNIWLKSFSSPPTHTYTNLTGFLLKLDLWVLAFQRANAHFSSAFPPRNAIPSLTLLDLLALRNSALNRSFKWTQTHLNSPKRPSKLPTKHTLGSFSFDNRVLQEVLLMLLEPLFEPRFSKKAHGFRPGRDAHTAIRTIRSHFAGYLWFIKGDLTELFDSEGLDATVIMDCLAKVVKDRTVLGLVKSALKAETGKRDAVVRTTKRKGGTRKKILDKNEPKPDPYWLRTFFEFAPKEAEKIPSYGNCGILSPLLANVVFSELDFMMERKIEEFFIPSKDDSIWKESINDGCHNPSWPEFVPTSGTVKSRKMDYIRYGGHFLIGIRGPREDAVRVRKDLIEFCEKTFGVRLDNSRVEIEHITRGIQFLDHIISRRVIYPTLRYTASGGSIVSQKGVGTLLSVTASLQQCIRQFRKLQFVKGDKDPEPLPCTPMLYSSQAHTNSQMNKFLETMADWYRYADNRKKVVGFCAYVIRSSLAKLYAARYRLKSRAKVYKIASRDLSHPLVEKTNNAAPEYSDLLRMGLVDAIEGVQFSRMAMIPSCDYTPFPRNWVPEHEQVLREYVKLDDPKYFVQLNRSVKRDGLTLPQDEISGIVWDWKTLGVRRHQFHSGE